MSKAKEIAAELSARLSRIGAANGYLSEIGERVYRGKRKLDEGNIPCAVIVEDDDSVEDRVPGKVKLAQVYYIEGHSECDPDQPNDKAHDILADIKTAIWAAPENLGGLVKELRYVGRTIGTREDGLALVSAAIEIEAVFVETLAAP